MASTDRGSVRWHQNRWEIRVQVGGKRVTRRVKAPNTRAGRRAAEEACEQLSRELGLGTDGMTVAQLIERYEFVRSRDWSPSTQAGWPHHTGPIVEAIGDVEVSRLTALQIEEMHAVWLTAGAKATTVRRRHAALSAALRQAEVWDVIAFSPARKVTLPTVDRRDLGDLPGYADVRAKVIGLKHERLKVAALLALATGARRGEMLALRWTHDIDLKDGTVKIRGALATGPDGTVIRKATKAGDRRPAIAIDEGIVKVLKAWRKTVQAEWLAAGAGRLAPGALVIPSPTDPRHAWAPPQVTREWIRHRDALGLAGLRWHDLRHLNATALLAASVPAATVASRLGHHSTRMTLEVYSHAVPAHDRTAADVLGALVATKRT